MSIKFQCFSVLVNNILARNVLIDDQDSRLTSLRNNVPQNGEDELLKKIHRQLEWLVSEEPDDHR